MGYIEQLLGYLLSFLEHEQKIYNRILKESPEGGMISAKRNGKTLYMHGVPIGKYPSGQRKYRKRVINGDPETMQALVGKEYARVALQMIEQDICMLRSTAQRIRELTFDNVQAGMRRVYRELPEEYFRMIRQGEIVDERLKQWAREPFEQSSYRVNEKKHTTSRGLNVRSRAELLIAEMLYRYDIPFRYEQVIHIGKYEMAPDFTFLDFEGKELYWEYCGMMSEIYYADRQLWRRGLYESVGINEWTNMIYTYDDTDSVDMREIEAIIRTKILPRIRPETADI